MNQAGNPRVRVAKSAALGAAILVSTLVGWYVFQSYGPAPEIIVSKQTTWLTEPLADDGLPDYAGYLLARAKEGVTPETNGAIPFLRAMWPAGLDERDYRPLCDELGMEIPRERGMRDPSLDKELIAKLAEWLLSIDPERAKLARREEHLEEGDLDRTELIEAEEQYTPKSDAHDLIHWAIEHPWRREQAAPLAEWVDRHAPYFDLLHESAARERFYCPSPDLLETPQVTPWARLPTLDACYQARDRLRLRAHYSLGEQNIQAAWRDCRAIFRLVGHVPPEFLVGELASIGNERSACLTALTLLSDPHLDAATAREMLEFFRELPPRGGMAEIIDSWERMAALSYCIGMSRQGSDLRRLENEDEVKWSERSFERSLDWNWILSELNSAYDEIVAEIERANSKQEAIENPFGGLFSDESTPPGPLRTVKAYLSRTARTGEIGQMLMPALYPAWRSGMEAQTRSNNERQLLTVATAVTVYRLEQGAYPEHLSDLVPDLLPALPADPFHGSPPVYRRTNEGFLLYSLGPNGQDDGGSNDQHDILEGFEVVLYDLEETLENENHLRELLGRAPVTEAEYAEFVKSTDDDREEENKAPAVKKLAEEIPDGADDYSIRLPLPRLKLPLPGFPPPRE